MVITIAAQKGGVAKTTTSITLASYFSRKGKKVLLIDLDGQGNTSYVVLDGHDDLPKEKTVASILLKDEELYYHAASRIPNLYISPSHVELSQAEKILSRMRGSETQLKRKLTPLLSQFDIVIIDCPPNVNDLPFNAFVTSDYIIIPFQADGFNLKGIKLMLDDIAEAKNLYNQKLELLGMLATIYDQTTKISREIYNSLVDYFGMFSKNGKVFDTKIPKNVDISVAQTKRQDIFAYNPKSQAAQAYTKLIETELIPYFLKHTK